jgi:hypothetical protein
MDKELEQLINAQIKHQNQIMEMKIQRIERKTNNIKRKNENRDQVNRANKKCKTELVSNFYYYYYFRIIPYVKYKPII